MRLTHVRVQNYRCIRDTGWFEIEQAKTILVGLNEAGKTAVLNALQQIHPPAGVKGFDALRDYPRKLYNADIQSQKRDPSEIPVASARFSVEPDDLAGLPDEFSAMEYCCTRDLNNELTHWLEGGPEVVVYSEQVRKDLRRLATHANSRAAKGEQDTGLRRARVRFFEYQSAPPVRRANPQGVVDVIDRQRQRSGSRTVAVVGERTWTEPAPHGAGRLPGAEGEGARRASSPCG